MTKKSKADVIKILLKKKLKFKIPKTYSFTTKEWYKNQELLKKEIKKKFANKTIIARSSAMDEDGDLESAAGKYLSIQNLNVNKIAHLTNSINKVINSYKIKKKENLNNQIIIQEQIKNVSMSGVLFTFDLDTGAPYYSINYDDKSGKTNTVTSGLNSFSNRRIYVLRSGLGHLRSERFKSLLQATVDLEKKLNNNLLDIEFAVDKKLNPYIFQVRNITSKRNWKKESKNLLSKNLLSSKKKIQKILKKQSDILGNNAVLGQMPDWNPVEMIGLHPSPLSFSLYKSLITDKTWSEARHLMGYHFPRNKSLMHSIAGKPYIDTRLSFNSFLPKNIKKSIAKKVVNFWLFKLKNNPELYDKIEFDIAITCFSFDKENKYKNNFPINLTKKEFSYFFNLYKSLTAQAISKKNRASISNMMKIVKELNFLNSKNKDKDINYKSIQNLLNICRKKGIFPFAICARHAFIAKTIMNSLVSKNIINKKEIEKFLKSVKTVATELLTDMNNVFLGKFTRQKFMLRYGHLRPNTYDITSKRYDEYKNFKFTKQKKISSKKFKFSKIIHKKINNLLEKNKIRSFNSKDLIDYFEQSIISREYSKFVFTKTVSNILQKIILIGKKHKITRDDLAYIHLNDLKKNKRDILKCIKKNKDQYNLDRTIKLPEVIYDLSAVDVIPYQVNRPNFISNKKIISNFVSLKKQIKNFNLKNNIALIENADPGYDWIFSRGVSGLITKYGGINSHMSIRCAELNIPAAIGCGEKQFNELKKGKKILLDCKAQKIIPLK